MDLCQVMVRTSNHSGKICDIFTRIKETAKCIRILSVCLFTFLSKNVARNVSLKYKSLTLSLKDHFRVSNVSDK